MNPKRKLSVTQLANTLKMSRQTVASYLKEHQINYQFSDISNQQLDDIVMRFQQRKPASGAQYLTGHLRQKGLKVQKRRIRESMRRVDRLGHALRSQSK
jgi:predicted transcriptional regulator